ncbi:flavin reductase family protein [Salinarimonas ramus]|uniref:Flavin reductase n=1 Tax=Salinarimonas ramus TaxID=690164 RepID=A0A917Q8G0_9HYPH|nr:flavin reductase family protein [Salinarimonas ramus]GGK35618.1 flavin reductase [Salinarimonas ramus]
MTRQILSFETGPVDPRELRTALGRFATGVTVITTRGPDGKREGLTANSFSALSLDPPLVLWSIKTSAASLPTFRAARAFAIHVLAHDQADLSHRFATPAQDKFAGLAVRDGLDGLPMLEGTLATFECALAQDVEGGDHRILVGRVRRASYGEGAPLLFSAGRYGVATPLPRDVDASSDLASLWDGLA